MKALLYKDLCALKSTLKFTLIFLVFFALAFGNFSCAFITCYLSMMVTTSINLDIASRWNRYAVILPVSRKTLVLEKYIFLLLLLLAGASLATLRIVLGLLIPVLYLEPIPAFITIAAAICIGIWMNALSIPVSLRFPEGRSTLILMALFAVMFGAMAVIANLLDGIEYLLPSLSQLTLCIPVLVVLFLFATLIIFWISLRTSIRIFKKQEV